MHEIGRAVDRVNDPPRLLAVGTPARLLAPNRQLRRTVFENLSNGFFSGDVGLGYQIDFARLGFVALDYSILADGTPMLWEANPYPDIGVLDKGLKGVPRRKSEAASIQLRGLARFFWKLSVTPERFQVSR